MRHQVINEAMKVDSIKLPFQFNSALLKEDLQRLNNSAWINHFVQQNYEGTWDVLPLRGPLGATHPVMMAYSDPLCKDFEDTVFLRKCKYIQEVLTTLKIELFSVRLMKLKAGSMIKEHRDIDLSIEEGAVRLHIPICTNAQVDFYLNKQKIIMAEGECWYLRLSDPHSVINNGQDDRVHLVIDAPASKAFLDLISQPSHKTV